MISPKIPNFPKWLRDLSGSFVLSLIARALGLANAAMLARILQPESYGLYSYALAIVTALSLLAQFGIPTIVTKEIAAAESQGNWSQAKGVIKWGYKSISILVVIVFLVLSLIALTQYEHWGHSEILTYSVSVFMIPLLALEEMRIAILNGLRKIMLSRVPGELLRSTLVCLCLVWFMVFPSDSHGMDAAQAMTIIVIVSVISFGIGTWILVRVEPQEIKHCKPHYSSRQWITSALPIALTAGIGFLNQSTATLILGAFLSKSDVGYYRIAMLGSNLVLIALTTINSGLAPYFSRSFAGSDWRQLQHLAVRSAQLALAVSALIVMTYFIFGHSAIVAGFGEAYADAYAPLLILAIGQLVTAATGSAGVILYMTGNGREVSIGAMLGAVINVIANVILVPRYGIVGAACATVVSESVWTLTWCYLLWKRIGIISFPIFRK